MNMKYIFIINPTAGTAMCNEIEETLQKLHETQNLEYETRYTTRGSDATRFAAEYSAEDDVTIVACGGDGTVYEVINGIRPGVRMAIIPTGTGNDFYRMIGPKKDVIKLIEETINGQVIDVDYGVCNGRPFMNCTTMGIDAIVNEYVCESLKKTIMPKAFMYAVAAVKSIFNPKPFMAEITIDDQKITKEVLLVAVMNGRYYGNGISPTINADITDGLFDICIVKKVGIPLLVTLLPVYFAGKGHLLGRYITFIRGKDVKVSSNIDITFQSDGESYHGKNLDITIKNKALPLQVPCHSPLLNSSRA